MPLEIAHNVEKGVYQLLNAPKDVPSVTELPSIRRSHQQEATPEHQKLFDAYRKGFQFFYPLAESWWKGCIASEMTEGRTRDQAVQAAFEKRVAGPASVPEFVWFIRYFWLRCDNLNKSLPVEQRVPPEDLILGWLVEAGEEDSVTLVTCMPYWPLGQDENGEWC